jgi:protein-tyrosine-phosphatase
MQRGAARAKQVETKQCDGFDYVLPLDKGASFK